MRRKRWVGSVVALVLTMASGPALAATKDLGTVKLGWGPWISDAPFFVSMAKGFFEAEGVRVEAENFASSA